MTRMTVAERERYLADVHIGVLSVADEDGRGPLLVPIGYHYEPGGDIRISTGRDSRKMQLIRKAGRVGFLVQTEEMPFKYVAVEGPVVGEEPADPDEQLALDIRYLGPELGRQYFEDSKDGLGDMVTVRIRPLRWRTYDMAKE